MSPQPTTTTESKSRNTSTLSITDKTAKELDGLADRAERRTREVLGYAVRPNRGQIVAELVSQAASHREDGQG